MKIYVASSWRNAFQQDVVRRLKAEGHVVYDFKNPRPGDKGFGWSAIDPLWQKWTSYQYQEALHHPIAKAGFASDFDAMRAAEACVLVLPCGRSAHLEAGWFVGAGRRLFILLDNCGPNEPELMYAMATSISRCLDDLVADVNQAHADLLTALGA